MNDMKPLMQICLFLGFVVALCSSAATNKDSRLLRKRESSHGDVGVDRLTRSLEALKTRWNNVETSVCGPKPGQAHILLNRHNMTVAYEKASWKIGPYIRSPLTTASDIWKGEDRQIYSNPYMMLEGPKIKPWVNMEKSAVLLFWHRGGYIVVHTIDGNGNYAEALLGDELLDPNANFSMRFEPNTWWAMELEQSEDEGAYGFFSAALIPAFERKYMRYGTEEELVRLAGEDKREVIQRFLRTPAPSKSGNLDDLQLS